MIEATFEENDGTVRVAPPFGRPVTFVIQRRTVGVGAKTWSGAYRNHAERFVVALKGSTGLGFSTHTSYDAACKSLLSRARRYHAAYSKPRRMGVAA